MFWWLMPFALGTVSVAIFMVIIITYNIIIIKIALLYI